MKVLERKDAIFVEIMDALLQLIKMLNRESVSHLFVIELKEWLDEFLKKVKFFAYVKKEAPCIFENKSCNGVLLAIFGDLRPFQGVQKHFISDGIHALLSDWSWQEIRFEKSPHIVLADNLSYVIIYDDGFVRFFKNDHIDSVRRYINNEVDHFFSFKKNNSILEILYCHYSAHR